MSMSTIVVGYRPADMTWTAMKNAWDACRIANVQPPKEVSAFFDGVYPDDQPGKEVTLGPALREWSNDNAGGYELDLALLPKDVRFIRFYNSW